MDIQCHPTDEDMSLDTPIHPVIDKSNIERARGGSYPAVPCIGEQVAQALGSVGGFKDELSVYLFDNYSQSGKIFADAMKNFYS